MHGSPYRGRTTFGGFGVASGMPPPRDLLVLLGVLFVTFSLQHFQSLAGLVVLLRLTPAVHHGFLWQLVTYPLVGTVSSGIFILLELLILYWFGRDIYWRLGRRRFWRLLATAAVSASVAAALVQLLLDATGLATLPELQFAVMQGQRILLATVIAAFATLYGQATILLMFVLPVQARWFLPLEILFAFLGFLSTKDFAGFLGICTAVLLTYASLSGKGLRGVTREWGLRARRELARRRLHRLRKERPFEVVGDDDDRWLH